MPQESEDILENFIFNGREPSLSLENDAMIVENMLTKLTAKYKQIKNYELSSHFRHSDFPSRSFEENIFVDELNNLWKKTYRKEEGYAPHYLRFQTQFSQSHVKAQLSGRFHDALQDRRIIYETLEELSIEKPDIVENWKEIFDMLVCYPHNILKSFPLEYQEIFGEKNCDVFFSYLRPDFLESYKSESEKKSLDSNLEYPVERDVDDNCDALTKFEERCKNKKTNGLYCQIHQDYHPSEEESSDRNDEYDHDSSRWSILG